MEDPGMAEVEEWFRRLLEVAPGGNVQLSGGEPTMRDDLPQLIALGRSMGLTFLQLNTNGLRLAAEDGYAEQLAAAGLSTVFLQFDGVDDAPYLALRGRPLAALKEEAIEHCAAAGLGVVLVPTVARGINLAQLGSILDFALAHLPSVRGIHIQPLALLGRYPPACEDESARVTLPEVMRELAAQSRGRIRLDDLTPGDCEHALCSFSREYLCRADGSLAPLGPSQTPSCGCASPTGPRSLAPADKAAHVARRWTAVRSSGSEPLPGQAQSCCPSETTPADKWTQLLREISGSTFSVSGMAFQDAWTIDLERLRTCYLHVLARDGRVVPFCSYNLTGSDGQGLATGRQAQDRGESAQTSRRYRSGCMVCGAELDYSDRAGDAACEYCGRVGRTTVSCPNGHFVCDGCHGADAVALIERICSQSRETDCVALMQAIRSHPRFPLHGPEHHSLVAAVILTALRNSGSPIANTQIATAIERGQTVAGGACGFIGVCGAAAGVGIATSLLVGAHPCHGEKRQLVQRVTHAVLAAIAAYDAPRCCQRDSWLALREASVLLPELTGVSLMAHDPLVCDQHRQNKECIGERCPLFGSN